MTSWVHERVNASLTCRGQSAMLMSPLIPSGWNIVCVAPVVKDNIAFLSFTGKNTLFIQHRGCRINCFNDLLYVFLREVLISDKYCTLINIAMEFLTKLVYCIWPKGGIEVKCNQIIIFCTSWSSCFSSFFSCLKHYKYIIHFMEYVEIRTNIMLTYSNSYPLWHFIVIIIKKVSIDW